MERGKRLTLTIEEARAVAVAAQSLDVETSVPVTGKAIMRTVDRLGVLQVDTISVVERSQYLVLWSRLGAYDPTLLDTLIYPKRTLFECMAPVALIAPMRNYRYYRPRMLRMIEETHNQRRAWILANPTVIADTLETIRRNGPMASADFERPPDSRRTGPWDWHGPKPSRAALEMLFDMGEIMVHSRRAGQKVYDVRERVLAHAFNGNVPADDTLPTHDERLSFFARHAVEALGIVQPAWLWEYHAVRPPLARGTNRKADALAMLETLAAEGVVEPIAVAGLDGPSYIATSLLPPLRRYKRGQWQGRTTLLSPFDSLIWDRQRTRALFDFDVCFEAYVPPPKRKYGYYCLSILHGGRLVGRVDPKMDRASRMLLIRAVYLEPEASIDDPLLDGLASALWDLARFLGGDSIVVGENGDPMFGQALAERVRSCQPELVAQPALA
jgi:uncharacterized protein YcaQ